MAISPLHPASITPKQRELIGIARELGREKFYPRAREHDESNQFPYANYADLTDAGFLGLTIPERYGGFGADFETYALVSAELARWCPPTALTFNMHACSMMWSSQMADDLPMDVAERAAHEEARAGIYAKVLNDGSLFAQPFSEPDSSAAAGKAAFATTATPVAGGYRINGIKHFASLSGAANYYSLVCTEARTDREPSPKDTIFLAVPSDAPGVSIFGDWNVVGMRPTDSRSLRFDDVFVSESLRLLPNGVYFQAAVQWPHMFMTLSPSYLGLSQAVFDFTVRYLRGEIDGAPPAGSARRSAVKQMAVAEMRIKLEQAKALFFRAITEARPKPDKETRLRAYATQWTVMEYANDIARIGLRTCGGRALFKNFDIERWYRDSRCGALMLPWTAEICLERLGHESVFERGEK
ncbi:MAG: acyl-CoA dehydrogenase family protein [Pseudomonadota bacterium]